MDIEFKISKKPVNYKKALELLEKRVDQLNVNEILKVYDLF